MNVEIIKRESEAGGLYFRAVYPEFSCDNVNNSHKYNAHIDNINNSVKRFVDAAASSRGGLSITVETKIYLCTDDLLSFTADVLKRGEHSLDYCRRFCFNWDVKRGVLLPLSAVTDDYKRLIRANSGCSDYSISENTLYLHKNSFNAESGKTCRRSAYARFLTSEPCDLRALRIRSGGVFPAQNRAEAE